jgi:3-hydroxyisobutyrate dehydrogenase-like beta-hydroxyacid dehydrogenase
VNNLAAFGNAIFARECLNLGLKAGLDFKQMAAAIKVSTGYSRGLGILEMQIKRMIPAPTGPSSKGQTKSLDDKDRDFALELADVVGASAPLAHLMAELDLEKTYDAINRL